MFKKKSSVNWLRHFDHDQTIAFEAIIDRIHKNSNPKLCMVDAVYKMKKLNKSKSAILNLALRYI